MRYIKFGKRLIDKGVSEIMDREQIIKALERCTSGEGCRDCPRELSFGGCFRQVMINALSLIKSQEQRIKELTEDVALWEESADKAIDIAEGNIRAEIASGGTSCHWCEDKVRADTVREFAVRLIKHFDKAEAFTEMETDFLALEIEQIAKEMLEEK
jgi:hypothetical protein